MNQFFSVSEKIFLISNKINTVAACKDCNESWSSIVEGECTKERVFSEGLFECTTMVGGYCYNIAQKGICRWHRSVLTGSDCSVDLFVVHVQVRSYSLFRMRVMVWMLAQDRFLHCDAGGRVTVHMCGNCLDC